MIRTRATNVTGEWGWWSWKIMRKVVRYLWMRCIMHGMMQSRLLLDWYWTGGSLFRLKMVFGVKYSVWSLFIRFSRRILVYKLASNEFAKNIAIPTKRECHGYKCEIADNDPYIHVYPTADGLKQYLEQPGEDLIQNMFYNGWKSDHFFTNVLVFVPEGHIITAIISAPGCMHDSKVSEWGGGL